MNIIEALEKFDEFRKYYLESINIIYLDSGHLNSCISLKKSEQINDPHWPEKVKIKILDISSYKLQRWPNAVRLPLSSGIHFSDFNGKMGVDIAQIPHPVTFEKFLSSPMFFLGGDVKIELS